MAKTANVLQVLLLFTDRRQQLGALDIARLLKVSRASAYRYLAELEQAALVEAASPGRYVLGPAIVELDRQIRVHDPLIAAASEILRTLSERTGGTTLLARWHGRKVICVDQVPGRFGPGSVSYERGRAMPFYRGATSTAILAHLDRDAIRRLAAEDGPALRKAGLPSAADALWERLGRWRNLGVIRTEGAVDADAIGWAMPIHQGGRLLGSMSVVLSREAPDLAQQRIADALRRASLRVEGRLERPAGLRA